MNIGENVSIAENCCLVRVCFSAVSEEEEEGGGGGGAMALARGMKTIGVPGKLLHESEGHTVTVRK